jgi:hypothetical protein
MSQKTPFFIVTYVTFSNLTLIEISYYTLITLAAVTAGTDTMGYGFCTLLFTNAEG